MKKKEITIVGSGWGCASFLKHIDNTKYNVSVISNNSKFLYTPLLANSITHDIPLEQHITKINNCITSIDDTVLNIDFVNKKPSRSQSLLNANNPHLSANKNAQIMEERL